MISDESQLEKFRFLYLLTASNLDVIYFLSHRQLIKSIKLTSQFSQGNDISSSWLIITPRISYCMSKKSCPFFLQWVHYKSEQDLFDILFFLISGFLCCFGKDKSSFLLFKFIYMIHISEWKWFMKKKCFESPYSCKISGWGFTVLL